MTMARQQIWEDLHGAAPILKASKPITSDQVQPASIDLRLGTRVWGVSSSRLPGPYQRVEDMLESDKEYTFNLSPNESNVLKRGQIYVIELMESAALSSGMSMVFTGKSSTARNGVSTHVLCDNHSHYDTAPDGHHGKLYVEVRPLAFDVLVKQGTPLVQGRITTKETKTVDEDGLRKLHRRQGLLFHNGQPLSDQDLRIVDNELYYHVDLKRPVVGFVAKRGVAKRLNFMAKEEEKLLEPGDFWVPITQKDLQNGSLTLFQGEFYLLATSERVKIPPEVCAQMLPSKITTGEFRVHFAGFFDSGFFNHGVLEVQAYAPYTITDGTPICSMKFDYMLETPDQLYGAESGSNYAATPEAKACPSLSKSFRDPQGAWDLPHWRDRFS